MPLYPELCNCERAQRRRGLFVWLRQDMEDTVKRLVRDSKVQRCQDSAFHDQYLLSTVKVVRQGHAIGHRKKFVWTHYLARKKERSDQNHLPVANGNIRYVL